MMIELYFGPMIYWMIMGSMIQSWLTPSSPIHDSWDKVVDLHVTPLNNA
jgi:hypothetical protein